MLKMVAFDLDGTIADTIPATVKAFVGAVSPYVGHKLTREEVEKTFGLNELGMIKQLITENHDKALEDYHKLFDEYISGSLKTYDGIIDVINFLNDNDIKVALLTGRGTPACMMILDELNIKKLFCDIETGRPDKPFKTEIMLELMAKYKVNSDEFIYVGDALSDVDSANKAGSVCLSACWGNNQEEAEHEKINKEYVMKKTEELMDFFVKEIGA